MNATTQQALAPSTSTGKLVWTGRVLSGFVIVFMLFDSIIKLAQIQVPWLDATARARIVESADRMTRTVEELDAARDRAAVTQEELQSKIAEATNQRLYVLSIITAVFLPLGFVCSLLGVNVGGVPLQHEDWAFWALCGAFVAVVAVQIWFFRRRGWFG